MSKSSRRLSKDEAARMIARGDQIGYRTKQVNGREVVEPINPQLQVIFENALWQLRPK